MIKKQTTSVQHQIQVQTQIVEISWYRQHEIIYESPSIQMKQLIFEHFELFLFLILLVYCITFYFMYQAFSKKTTNIIVNMRKESTTSDDMQNSIHLGTEQNELLKKEATSSTESSPREKNITVIQNFFSVSPQETQQQSDVIKYEKNDADNNFDIDEKNKDMNLFEDFGDQQYFLKKKENREKLMTSNNIEQNFEKTQNQKTTQILPDWSQYLENNKFEKLYVFPKIIGKGTFGEVYKCQKIVDLKEYAVKRIYFKVQNEKNLRDHPIFREINGLQEINHKNIVRYYTSWIQELNSEMKAEIKQLHDLVNEKKQQVQNDENDAVSSDAFNLIDENSYLNICVQFIGEGSSENDKQIQTISKYTKSVQSVHLSDFSSQIQSRMRRFHFNPNQKDEQFQIFMLYIEVNYQLYYQMELCDFTLKDFIEKVDRKKDKDLIKTIFKQIIEGVIYMHNLQFIHRDLKPQNIFINSKNEVKIGDLGLCNNRIYQVDEDIFQTNFEYTNNVGTPMYMAPEVKEDQYGSPADIYALGIILFEMLWKIKTNSEKFKLIQNLTKDSMLPPDLSNDYPIESELILKMVSPNPHNRPTAQQIYNTLNQQN
ncbi:unnamed protein product [Paramecium sonneborni]|uniref:non-specific serine/threonine protein kinase n=1 Tax=Paramecium sonneborni TaxID=65129 RepID=A0A8S1KK00_9CILI|nr:unnamed protein product [Paramecium sonneborni]